MCETPTTRDLPRGTIFFDWRTQWPIGSFRQPALVVPQPLAKRERCAALAGHALSSSKNLVARYLERHLRMIPDLAP